MENVFLSDHPLVKHKMTKLRDKNTAAKKIQRTDQRDRRIADL